MKGGEAVRDYFPKLLGNDSVKARIGRAVEEGHAPHAFLIGGPSGSGKNVLATEIAAALNCGRITDRGASLPCGTCDNCRRIYEGNFTDVKILEKPKDKATLGVELVKDFREDMFLSATESSFKIYIIDDAETMTKESQNALLKILEEPPEGVFILLLARESDRILTTIKSRTQYIAMSRFSEEEIRKFLLERSDSARLLSLTDKEKFEGALMSADGRLGLALRLVDAKEASENEEKRKRTLGVIESVSGRGGFSDIYLSVKALPEKRTELMPMLEEINNACRDLIVLKQDKDAPLIFFSNREEALKYSEECGIKRLLSLSDALCEAVEFCQKNGNVSNILTNLTARIKAGRDLK